MTRILVIDDDIQIRQLLKLSLEKRGYKVFSAENGEEGLSQVAAVKPDIVLLDLGLPKLDGTAMLKELRRWSAVPVIVLSVKNAEDDIVSLLNLGADDYMTKPFNTGELVARIQVALRHSTPIENDLIMKAGGLEMDVSGRIVLLHGREIKLTPTEYSLLKLFMTHAGRIITHSQILREIWGPHGEQEAGRLRVHVNQLRKKIEHNPAMPELLITEPGVGYRLKP
jgi:two-component system, OmpR family, KDP operon response regulator KdpE